MEPASDRALELTRRRFFGLSAGTLSASLGGVALSSLLQREASARDGATIGLQRPGRARRVIYLHMEGGPSHLDLFDHKPGLAQHFDQDLPDSVRNGSA